MRSNHSAEDRADQQHPAKAGNEQPVQPLHGHGHCRRSRRYIYAYIKSSPEIAATQGRAPGPTKGFSKENRVSHPKHPKHPWDYSGPLLPSEMCRCVPKTRMPAAAAGDGCRATGTSVLLQGWAVLPRVSQTRGDLGVRDAPTFFLSFGHFRTFSAGSCATGYAEREKLLFHEKERAVSPAGERMSPLLVTPTE